MGNLRWSQKKRALLRNALQKKTATRRAKSPAVKKSVSPVAELEQTIAKAQAQLSNLNNKAATQAQKSVDRIKGQLDKAAARQAAQRDKKNAAAEKVKANRTAATLKQLARARDALRTTSQKTAELRAQLKDAKVALKTSSDTLKKATALQKVVDKFESDWAKANQPKKRKATAKRRAKKAAPAAVVTEVTASE